jgi:chromosome segregation ATPase
MGPRFLSRRTPRLCAILLVGSLAGCTNVKDDADRTRAEGTVAGAGAGAAAGAGVGALANGKKGAETGAIAGAAAGGAAGAAYGNEVAKKKAGYAAQESALDAEISGLRQQVEKIRAYNESLQGVITEKNKKLAAVLASDRSAGPTAEEFDLRTSINSKASEIDGRARSWQETIDAHKAVLKKAADDPHSADLQKEIDELSEQRSEMLRQRANLVAIPDKLKQ